MKKRISVLCMALLLALSLCVPTLALDGKMEYVFDPDDLFTYYEWEQLEIQAAEISQRHNCGVYIHFVCDYNDFDYGGLRDTAETLYIGYDLGEGEGSDGILLLVSFYTEEYYLYVYGDDASFAFDETALGKLEDAFLPLFAEEDWCGGFRAYLEACDEALTYAEGIPTVPDAATEPDAAAEPDSPASDETPTEDGTLPTEPDAVEEPASSNLLRRILTVVGISCVISLLICLGLKGKMKSVHRKSEAKNYTANGGLQLTEQYDRFTHTTESVRRIDNGGSSGSKGGSGSGGKI